MYLCMSKCPYIHTLLPCPELLDIVLKTLMDCFILTLSFPCNPLKEGTVSFISVYSAVLNIAPPSQ